MRRASPGILSFTAKVIPPHDRVGWNTHIPVHFSHMNEPLRTYRNQAVADLDWILRSGTLVDLPCAGLGDPEEADWISRFHVEDLDWIQALDNHATEISRLADREKLLGRRFEALVRFWLEHCGRYELLGCHVPLRQGDRTLGELDFVFRERHSGRLVHLEVACKYYLHAGGSSGWESWKGLRREDTLERKIQLLREQTNRDLTPYLRGKPWYDQGERVFSRVLLRGYFFFPAGRLGQLPAPVCAGRAFSAGWYLRRSELHSLAGGGGKWVVLTRNRWIGQWTASLGSGRPLDSLALVHYLEGVDPAVGVMVVQADPHHGEQEISRGLIVPDQWPG